MLAMRITRKQVDQHFQTIFHPERIMLLDMHPPHGKLSTYGYPASIIPFACQSI